MRSDRLALYANLNREARVRERKKRAVRINSIKGIRQFEIAVNLFPQNVFGQQLDFIIFASLSGHAKGWHLLSSRTFDLLGKETRSVI
jgi:hypothetical protein